jgi:hypothetical protein
MNEKISLYSTVIDQARREAELIWLRISVFLIAHTIILQPLIAHLLAGGTFDKTGIIISFLGLCLSAVWWLLNFYGFCNHNVFFCLAHLARPKTNLPLLTDDFDSVKRIKPNGPIYLIIQLLPIFVASAYLLIFFSACDGTFKDTNKAFAVSILIGLLMVGVINHFRCAFLNKKIDAWNKRGRFHA